MQTILFSLKALTVAGILGVILSFSSEAQAQNVTVELIGGESYTASIDGQTDADYLWLSFEGVGSTLLRPVAWDSIVALEINDSTAVEGIAVAGDATFAELAQAALAVEAPAHDCDIEAVLAN